MSEPEELIACPFCGASRGKLEKICEHHIGVQEHGIFAGIGEIGDKLEELEEMLGNEDTWMYFEGNFQKVFPDLAEKDITKLVLRPSIYCTNRR